MFPFTVFSPAGDNIDIGQLGTCGYVDGVLAGHVIGLARVVNFRSPESHAKVVPEVLDGKKFICLPISEAFADSDLGSILTHS